jgi:hypothetical protein
MAWMVLKWSIFKIVSGDPELISTTRFSPSLNSLNTKKTTTYHVENPGSGLEQASNVAGIHQLTLAS